MIKQHLIVFISTNNAQHIIFILTIFILQSLLHVSMHSYHPQGVNILLLLLFTVTTPSTTTTTTTTTTYCN